VRFKDLGDHYDPKRLNGRQISWVERKEFVNFSVFLIGTSANLLDCPRA
jgi:hypothetical protein